jgi:hypothetical protein
MKLYNILLGVLDYYRFPAQRASWGGAFNGQGGRMAIFQAIMHLLTPALILETGTFRGTTTDVLADHAPEVITVEGRPRTYGFALARLWMRRNVRLRLGDSRVRLREVLATRRPVRPGSTFAYLDAHWNADLPLAEELEIVFAWDPEAIIMIDDYQVPGDPGYTYDDYGLGASLNADYIAPTVARCKLVAFYPAIPALEETGMKRGCVMLGRSARWRECLLDTGLLREA